MYVKEIIIGLHKSYDCESLIDMKFLNIHAHNCICLDISIQLHVQVHLCKPSVQFVRSHVHGVNPHNVPSTLDLHYM